MTHSAYAVGSHHDARRSGAAYWATAALGIVVLLFGVPILAGGAYLMALGGSWYYAIAGLALLATAYFLFEASMKAVWVYGATWLFTVAWALWEVGFDGWAQVPRLIAPTVILILVLCTIPVLRRP